LISSEEARTKIQQQYTKDAIRLAMQGQWEEAVAANKAILELFPNDADSYNRLGKALLKLGEYAQAKEAYNRALELNPRNSIARNNLDRLSHLDEPSAPPKGNHHKVALDLFIEETGKSGVVRLLHLAPKKIIAGMATGDEVYLKVEGQTLLVQNEQGEHLGEVEPRYGMRLAKLIEGGNKYIAAISSLSENEVKISIREVYQHPSQAGRLSFPLVGKQAFPMYVGEEFPIEAPEIEPVEEYRSFTKIDIVGIAEEDDFGDVSTTEGEEEES
jgi:tetratricopeptide (TPR) repeat protein